MVNALENFSSCKSCSSYAMVVFSGLVELKLVLWICKS